VIDKPAGLVVHPAPGHGGVTLVELLEGFAGGGEAGRPGIVHRLDKGTSGLMLVARDDETHRALAGQIRRREVEREYVALVEGSVASKTGTIEAPIGRDPRRRERMAVAGRAARQAVTHFRVLERLPRATLVEVRLETGRTHQIRAHFTAIGHPLVGDGAYGGPRAHGLDRQFLHSRRIAFAHPRSGERLEFRSELPKDLEAALAGARAG
jgi:23S rRNA pseudouridine1911/1915/1917 synthase